MSHPSNSCIVSPMLRRALLGGGAVASLIVAACSSDDPSGSSSDAAGSNTTQPANASTVSVGGSTGTSAPTQGTSATGGPASTGGGQGQVSTTGVGGANTTASATGATSAGGDAGVGGTEGVAGSGGAATATSTGGSAVSTDYVSDVQISVHENVNTILVVTWTQTQAADQVWLEFSFESGAVMTSPPQPGTAGEHRDKVLGVPGDTDVTIRVVSSVGATSYITPDHLGRTDPIPNSMPVPEVSMYDAENASENRWLFGSVEDSPSASGNGRPNYYTGQFWLYIIDRQGRIVWYYNNPANNASSSFQRIARDGQYIWVDQGRVGDQGVVKMTLDREYFETIDIPVSDAVDVTDDGSVLYDDFGTLREYSSTGQDRELWSCEEELDLQPNCYSNTVNWNEQDDTVLLSFPEPGSVVEIDRASGDLVAHYGNQPGAWDFAAPLTTPPSEWRFGVQHFANITTDGTLMVSSHLPPHDTFTQQPYPGEHAFIEFSVDRNNQTLTELWRYTEGQEWPHAKGMAIKLDNGNVLANYGTGGVIREITPDKQTVFYVKFDLPGGNDAYNKMVGHNELIDDLYALNGGPE